MRKISLTQLSSWALAAVVSLSMVLAGAPARAQSPNGAQSIDVPFSTLVFVPCAAGGAGELVDLSGTLHIVSQFRFNPDGTVHVVSHFNPQGVSGVGETTGAKYQGTGVTETVENLTAGAQEFTSVNNFRIIGQGPDNNLLVHSVAHFTINANGVETATVTVSSDQCQ
jgi:hypothetical protein